MSVQSKKLLTAILTAVITSMVFMNIGNTIPATAQEPGRTVVRDSTAMLLSGQTIPGGSFIHLYDTTPYQILNGHVAAKIPCDDESNATLAIVTGSAPVFQPAELELLQNLSTPGELCLYHADLPQENVNVTTDIAILNPGEEDVEFPDTSTVVIGINEVMAGTEAHEGHAEPAG
jgi:hypothetical protein